ncbi:MAG: glycosyltransferase [Phycisphaerae bacterium]|nr:glycosyltransferase [Phycisphaerae bacterium]
MLTLSVILPTHAPDERAEGLAAAVDSLLNQTRRPDQLVIVHDGPGRAPDELAGRVRSAGVGCRSVRSAVASLPRSRNVGIDAAVGHIVVFGEDDLTFPPDYLQRVASLYAADTEHRVAGIGSVVREPGAVRRRRRAWDRLSRWLGEGRWGPRRQAARRVALPPSLRRRLRPCARLPGGGLTLRREIAAAERFDETMRGYALGEDMEFCYRVAPRHALYRAPELAAVHAPASTGRPKPYRRGRMYAAGMLRIAARTADGGAGTWLLAGYQLAGMALLYAAWSLPARCADNARFAAGVVVEVACAAARGARRTLCGY